MPSFTIAQLLHEPVIGTGGPVYVSPSITTAPVVAAVIVGGSVTYTAASGVTGIPTPTVVHDLYKNSALFRANYTSGTYVAALAGDTLFVRATATNSIGFPAVKDSASITVGASASIAPSIATAPVVAASTVGQPVTYTPASGVVGNPTPTVAYDLYKNASLFTAAYVSGAYTAATAGDVLFVRATASNGVGSPAVKDSANVTVASIPVGGSPVFRSQSPMTATIGTPYFYPYDAVPTPTSYAISSGTLPAGFVLVAATGVLQAFDYTGRLPTPLIGTYNFTVSATNASGTVNSDPQTLIVTYLPSVIGAPRVGVPTNFVVPGYYDAPNGFNGTPTSPQWYKNTGSGPVLISGATSLSYSPVTGDLGAFLSIRCLIDGVAYSSTEFPVAGQFIPGTMSDVLGNAAWAANLSYYGRYAGAINSGATFGAPMTVRYTAGTGHYKEVNLAPGVYGQYAAGFGTYTDLTPYGATSTLGLRALHRIGCPAVISQQTDPAPATATRPAYNTGIGFFVANGAIYDANGNKFRPRGVNQLHDGSGVETAGLKNTNANVVRNFVSLTGRDFATFNKPLMQRIIANSMVVVPTFPTGHAQYLATISGSVMTITTATNGYVPVETEAGFVTAPAGVANTWVKTYGTGTGKLGTYNLVTAAVGTSAAPVAMALGTSTVAGVDVTFKGYINTNNSLVVTSVLTGDLGASVGQNVWINGRTSSVIDSFVSGTGGTGSYLLRVNMSITTPTAMTSTIGIPNKGTSGSTEPTHAICAAYTWVEQVAGWSTLERWAMYNVTNEWGPSATSAVTDKAVWLNTNKQVISIMRAGGYTGTIWIDAPGSGQDGGNAYTILRDSGDLFDSDPQRNTVVSLHIYGTYRPGNFAAIAAKMAQVTADRGVPFVIGEYGCEEVNSPLGDRSFCDPRETIGVCEAYNMGHLFWAVDDHETDVGDEFYAGIKLAGTYQTGVNAGHGGGYKSTTAFPNGDPAELTKAGKAVVLDAVVGLKAIAVKATVFP